MALPKIEVVKIRLTGTRPLIMARGESANPFDPQAREIKRVTQKRNKSDEDYELIARLQFNASLYWDERIGPYLPVDNLMKCCQEGAAKYREGKLVKSRVIIKGFVGKATDDGAAELVYQGGKGLEELYDKHAYLKMGKLPGSKTSILISRARFNEWAADIQVEFTDVTKERILDYWNTAGRLVGIGAWRPQNGLFMAEVLK